MNEIREIAELLDGYTVEKVGYKLTSVERSNIGWILQGCSYLKEDANVNSDEPDLADLVNRISNRGKKWKVGTVTVWETTDGIVFKMLLRKD